MVQSAGDWVLQVEDGVLGRKHWLEPNQVIRLTESGITVVFEPTVESAPTNQPKVADATASTAAQDEDANLPNGVHPPLPSRPPLPPSLIPVPGNASSPATPNQGQSQASPPTQTLDAAAQTNHSRPWFTMFRGKGTLMIGQGTITFSAVRSTSGPTKTGSLVVPLTDVTSVKVTDVHVCVSFKLDDVLSLLTFDATTAKDAALIASSLLPDELNEIQRKRTQAAGHAIAIDPSPPRVFSVVF